jgi:hypothetical protein
MAIIQISKLQQRTGNLVDLPQLDEGEFGWANDDRRLFIGKTTPQENIEVLTSYSQISFSQVEGSDGGNLNISNAQMGQVLTYDAVSNVWINSGGNASQPNNSNLYSNTNIHLGAVSNVKIGGGAIGYILETDGAGNLSWTPKGTLYTNIIALSNATPIVMRVAPTVPYTNQTEITISGANGANANSIVNGRTFYVKLSVDYPTSGNVQLYTDVGLSTAAIGTNLGVSTPNVAIATSVIGGTGSSGGGGATGGSNTTVQFNDSGISNGVAGFTFNKLTTTLAVTGNVNVGNLNSTSAVTGTVLISNISTGTAPLTVTSSTRVSNLSVAYANVSDFGVTTTRTSGTFYPTFVSGNANGNFSLSSNANLSFDASTGRLTATQLGGTLTTVAQPNITSVGTLSSLAVTGNVTAANFQGALANGTSNVGIPAVNGNVVVTAAGNSTLTVTGTGANITGTLNVTGNVTGNLFGPLANGTSNVRIPAINGNVVVSAAGNANILTVTGVGSNIAGTFGVSGNANVGNLGTSGRVIASIIESNVATGTAPLTVASTTRVTNLNVAYANVSDFNAMTVLTTGTYYPTFISGTAAANYALGSNTAYSANIANGSFTATTFVGALSGAATSATTAGTVTTNAQPNITSTGTLSSLAVTGNVTAGNVAVSTGSVLTTQLTTGANTTAGTITGNWTLSSGSRLLSTYADLAEYYEADAVYEPGTVLAFGGDKEVTLAEDGTTRVAGVVSTDPAYGMNAKCLGIAVAIALQGRVPTKVRGTVRKGDMMVSAGNGFARPWNNPAMGTVIGKALENFDGIEGVIEVAVGRL